MHEIREEKLTFLRALPQIYGINSGPRSSEMIGDHRKILYARSAGAMDSVRISLQECIIARLREFKMTDFWSYPPELTPISGIKTYLRPWLSYYRRILEREL